MEKEPICLQCVFNNNEKCDLAFEHYMKVYLTVDCDEFIKDNICNFSPESLGFGQDEPNY